MQNQGNGSRGERTPDRGRDQPNRDTHPQVGDGHEWPFTQYRRNAISGIADPVLHPHQGSQQAPARSSVTTPAAQHGDLPSNPITDSSVDRSLTAYAEQGTNHLTVGPNHPWFKHRQPRIFVGGRNQYQYTWEYPYREGRPMYRMTNGECAAYIRQNGNSVIQVGHAGAIGGNRANVYAPGGAQGGQAGGQGGSIINQATGQVVNNDWMDEYVESDPDVDRDSEAR